MPILLYNIYSMVYTADSTTTTTTCTMYVCMYSIHISYMYSSVIYWYCSVIIINFIFHTNIYISYYHQMSITPEYVWSLLLSYRKRRLVQSQSPVLAPQTQVIVLMVIVVIMVPLRHICWGVERTLRLVLQIVDTSSGNSSYDYSGDNGPTTLHLLRSRTNAPIGIADSWYQFR